MNPRRSNSSLPQTGRSAYGVVSAVFLLAIPLVVVYGGFWLQDLLNFAAGVVSLVLLTCSVIWGLVAQDRMILNTRQRIIAQGIHRVTAVGSIAFLLLHIGVKLALDHVGWIAVFIPFGLVFAGGDEIPGSAALIGLGTLAGQLMIFVGITGALRNQFASPAPIAARWRAMHMLAYPAWCAGLLHGLYSGRPVQSPVFTVMYALCVLGVMAALALRAAPRPFKRQVMDKAAAIIGTEEKPGRENLEESRARVAGGATLPGYERADATGPQPRMTPGMAPRTAPLYEQPAPEPVNGFAAAYRAVTPPRPQQPYAADQTARMELPLDMQATEAIPRVDSGGSTSGSWPIPSPPPVGEAPPSAYDPLTDTGYNIPAYDNSGTGGYGQSDVYDTGETNTLYGTYNPDDTYNSGPANEPTPGDSYDFDSPGPGEPWNTPSGGYR
ncbi:cytochrome b/b6 domain-containing protein [Streptomyces sp. DG2A-72]|uniref:cytochrome b/b6 domain-containing protein n=1 Tax=Streptomyces sp. DG2A-72 TaxID=3051386 RepID=UPI00265BF100|nr:cytochrome b/b6 domain-containing protein [Streptomyces sp. DG2A-72]MDO0933078.1 cytochrome b/b6 domain-containing protein [Streptomyces sp. DG2A-72]